MIKNYMKQIRNSLRIPLFQKQDLTVHDRFSIFDKASLYSSSTRKYLQGCDAAYLAGIHVSFFLGGAAQLS
jgi:hypothetical protein